MRGAPRNVGRRSAGDQRLEMISQVLQLRGFSSVQIVELTDYFNAAYVSKPGRLSHDALDCHFGRQLLCFLVKVIDTGCVNRDVVQTIRRLQQHVFPGVGIDLDRLTAHVFDHEPEVPPLRWLGSMEFPFWGSWS